MTRWPDPARRSTKQPMHAIAKFPFIDSSRQAAGGASYGGHLANWLQATTTRYKCLISHAGLINLESQWGTSDTIYHRERGSGGPVVGRRERLAGAESDPLRRAIQDADAADSGRERLSSAAKSNTRELVGSSAAEDSEPTDRLSGGESLGIYAARTVGSGTRRVHAWLAKWLNGPESRSPAPQPTALRQPAPLFR